LYKIIKQKKIYYICIKFLRLKNSIYTFVLLFTFLFLACYTLKHSDTKEALVFSSGITCINNDVPIQFDFLGNTHNPSNDNQKHNLTSIFSFQEFFFHNYLKKSGITSKCKIVSSFFLDIDAILIHIFLNHKVFFSDNTLELLHYLCLIRV